MGVEELTYGAYEERQRNEVTRDVVLERVQALTPGRKFQRTNGIWEPVSYHGVSVVSMMTDSLDNDGAVRRVGDIQSELMARVSMPSALCPLPVASFHQTIANTFSADRYEKHISAQGLEGSYPDLLKTSFTSLPLEKSNRPIRMDLIGLSLFRTAIGLLGVFRDPGDFSQIIGFRDAFYGDPQLRRIGLERTRPFIGHVTLFYVERQLSVEERDILADVVCELNASLEDQPIPFYIHSTEPRWYDHLADFEPREDYPRWSFVKPLAEEPGQAARTRAAVA